MIFFRSLGRAGDGRSKCAHTSLAGASSITIGVILFILFTSHSFAATYTGTNLGAIPDGSGSSTCGTPRDVQFNVSGFTGIIGSTTVSFTMNPRHDYAGDLRVTLLAPDGTSHLLFARIGTNPADNVGDNANFDGTYVFSDAATGDLWVAAASSPGNGFAIPPGSYRTQAAGPFATDSPGPAFTSMNAIFVNLPTSNINGTWTLRFEDCAGSDTGTVSAAALTLIPLASANAMIIGRVLTSYGAGIRGVIVTAFGGRLEQPRFAVTSTFGYYRFDGLPAGESYVISVKAKRYLFEQPAMIVNLDQNVSDVNFISVQ